jgi:hypothetical protein
MLTTANTATIGIFKGTFESLLKQILHKSKIIQQSYLLISLYSWYDYKE